MTRVFGIASSNQSTPSLLSDASGRICHSGPWIEPDFTAKSAGQHGFSFLGEVALLSSAWIGAGIISKRPTADQWPALPTNKKGMELPIIVWHFMWLQDKSKPNATSEIGARNSSSF